MSYRSLLAAALIASVAVTPALAAERPNGAREMMRQLGAPGLSGRQLAKAIAKAEKHPLGSKANPVRENMPEGQLAYHGRLRCADGAAPTHFRQGNIGGGVYGNLVDHYRVACPGTPPVDVYMDMYHDGPELRPIPGFSMAADAVAD